MHHGKSEKDTPAGRQGAVEEILWCVMPATLEGHQSTGLAEQCLRFLKCHQGWKYSFLLGPDQVSNIAGMVRSAKQEQVSGDGLFTAGTSGPGPGRQSSPSDCSGHLVTSCVRKASCSILRSLKRFFIPFYPHPKPRFPSHPSATRISNRSKSSRLKGCFFQTCYTTAVPCS